MNEIKTLAKAILEQEKGQLCPSTIKELKELINMEEEDSTEEKSMRFGVKSTAKGFYYADWTVRADTLEEIKAKSEQLRIYALEQLKTLNPNI